MAVRAEPARGDRVELLAAEVAGHATETRSVSAACRASLAARRRRRCRPGSSTRVPAPSTYSTTRWLYWTVMVGNRDMAASSRWLWCRVRDSVVVCRARTSGRRHDASRGTGRRADRSGPLAMRRCRRRPPALWWRESNPQRVSADARTSLSERRRVGRYNAQYRPPGTPGRLLISPWTRVGVRGAAARRVIRPRRRAARRARWRRPRRRAR